MGPRILGWVMAAALLLTGVRSHADEMEAKAEGMSLECARMFAPWADGQKTTGRKYAPDLPVKVRHFALDVTPNFAERTIRASALLRFEANVLPASEVRLDAIDLRVSKVSSSVKIQAYQVTDEEIIVTFAAPVEPKQEAWLRIDYEAEPANGLYFRTPEMGYKEGDTHLFSQGEAIWSRHWYPTLDSPNVMFTSDMICRVPEGMTVISNGRLVSETNATDTKLRVFHWAQEKPHVNYLVTLVAGYFKAVRDEYRGIPLAFFTPPSEIGQASNSFHGTKEMMEFFEHEIGVKYAWPKYYQVCVNDFVAGGMENTSATTLTHNTLFTASTENIHTSQPLVAHELAHQWFGDLVTCKDWSHLWLNEGFATYYETLWQGHQGGRDAMVWDLYGNARVILGYSGAPLPIVRRTYDSTDEMFGHLSYQKGSWVLHMLRSQLGEELYRKCVQTFIERNLHTNVVTEDFRKVIEELSGRPHDQFFDQWLYHAHHPELDVTYNWDESLQLVRLSIRQVQKLSTNVMLFNTPLTIRFKGTFGTVDRTINVSAQDEAFSFPLDSAPEIVRVDPDYCLLAKIQFTPPPALLKAQLADTSDLMGRVLAVEQLGNKKDKASIAALKEVLNTDAFYGVRLEASKALRAIHSAEALDALVASTQQKDARVRRQVANDIGSFYGDKAFEFAFSLIEAEKNPAILSTVIRDLGAYSKPRVRELLLKQLDSTSYRNELTDAAIAALRLHDDPAFINDLHEVLTKREAEFTTAGFARGLSALAYLARNEEIKDLAREFLTQHVNSPKRTVRTAAISALGTLGDPKAIGVVEKFSTAAKDNRERIAADAALTTLRAGRKPVDDFKNLRQEVLDLKKAETELRKELQDLKRRLGEVATTKPPADNKNNGKPTSKSVSKPKPLRSPKS